MAYQVAWLREAVEDLEGIAEFIARDSAAAAASVIDRIQSAAEDLSLFPRMGPRVREWDDDDYRERHVFSYRLIYRIRPDRIEILGVIHGARLLPSAVRRRSAR